MKRSDIERMIHSVELVADRLTAIESRLAMVEDRLARVENEVRNSQRITINPVPTTQPEPYPWQPWWGIPRDLIWANDNTAISEPV